MSLPKIPKYNLKLNKFERFCPIIPEILDKELLAPILTRATLPFCLLKIKWKGVPPIRRHEIC